MNFDTAKYLAGATSRAKSDVANKLVSMFLHELSRRLSVELGISVTDPTYTRAVTDTFGITCAYCERVLERDRVAVEHLDGMNRYRVGLHIAGNVVVSCRQCNSEKRRDDSRKHLTLAATGWESFLAHDGARCAVDCKTCGYWKSLWPEPSSRVQRLQAAHKRIEVFRSGFPKAITFCEKAKSDLSDHLDLLYRECQDFASGRIAGAVGEAVKRIVSG